MNLEGQCKIVDQNAQLLKTIPFADVFCVREVGTG